jgi:hypothetical protein
MFCHVLIPWDFLVEKVEYLHRIEARYRSAWENEFERPLNIMRKYSAIRHQIQAGKKVPLENNLLYLSGNKASDKRDKIFAFLGLSSQDSLAGIIPIYWLSWEETYTNAMLSLFERGTGLTLLRCAGIASRHGLQLSLPSWVPDFTISILSLAPFVNHETYHATGSQHHHPFLTYIASAPAEISNSAKLYQCNIGNLNIFKGCLIDRVLKIKQIEGPIFTNGLIEPHQLRRIRMQISKTAWNFNPYITGETAEEVCWRTLVANEVEGKIPEPSSSLEFEDLLMAKREGRSWFSLEELEEKSMFY